jgi:outer membrane lipoprotein carrier protein
MTKLLLLLALAAPLSAQSLTATSLAKRVDNHYNHLQSLQAHYAERYEGMGLDRTETGTLTLRKPGRMRWAYDAPAGKLFILDGHDAISYTPGDPQATRFPEKQLDDLRSPLRFLLGHTELSKELDHLSLTVDASGQIHTMRIEEVDGSTTTFTFTAIHENIPTTEGDFTFTPPPGVTIVKATAPL